MLTLPLLAGCKKEEEKPDEQTCLLSEVKISHQNRSRQYFYNENGRLEKTQDIYNGLHDIYSLYQYDAANRLIQIDTYEKDNSRRFYLQYFYKPDGRLEKIINSRFGFPDITTFEYNAQGQIVKETVKYSSGELKEYANFTYAANRMKVAVFNEMDMPRGTMEYFFDEKKNPLAEMGVVAAGHYNIDQNYIDFVPMEHNVIKYIETEFNGDTSGVSYTAFLSFNEKGDATYKSIDYRYSGGTSVAYQYDCK